MAIHNFISVNTEVQLETDKRSKFKHLFYINVVPSIIFMLNVIYIEACT